LIKTMVKGYMAKEEHIIVEAITCKDDIENQIVHTLAMEADPEGKRTIGVMTKPDTIEDDCHGPWLRLLLNEVRPLQLGYFVVKNPTKKELESGIDFEEAREKEIEFFKTEPWGQHSSFKSKLGVDKLKTYLSMLLTDMIQKNLPLIDAEARKKLASVESQLMELPVEIESPSVELTMMVAEFCHELSELIKDYTPLEFWQAERKVFQNFKSDIRRTGPTLPPSTPPTGIVHIAQLL
jgi:hypothetical protein